MDAWVVDDVKDVGFAFAYGASTTACCAGREDRAEPGHQ